MKGGQSGPFLEVSLVLPALRQVRERWNLAATPPPGVDQGRSALAVTARVHNNVRSVLPEAVRDEFARRADWLARVRVHIARETRRAEVVAELRKVMDSVSNQGIGVSLAARNNLVSALANFESTQFDAAVRTAEELAGAGGGMRSLAAMGRTQPVAIEYTDALLTAADRFLDEAAQGLALRRQQLQAEAGTDLTGDKQRIANALQRLDRSLAEIARND
jgi:hypothetical protein